MFEWRTEKGALKREVYDVSGGSTIQNILIVSSAERIITPIVGYYSEKKGIFYKVDVDLILEEKRKDGMKLGDTSYENTYFCRLDPLIFP